MAHSTEYNVDGQDNPKLKLSIVLVTSAIPMHPKTDLVDLVIASLDLVIGVKECELIIVCDKMRIIEPDKKMNWKGGKVNELSQSKYEEYIQNLIAKYVKKDTGRTAVSKSENNVNNHTSTESKNVSNELNHPDKEPSVLNRTTSEHSMLRLEDELIEDLKYLTLSKHRRMSKVTILHMTSHMGFAHCLLEGLKMIDTEYVMVMQHDRAFAETIDIHPILNLLDKEKNIKYIGFQTAATKQYVHKKLKSKYRIKSSEKDLIEGDLIPIMYWYDSTHISRTKEYIRLIRRECKIGQFIETTYGGKIEKQISKVIEDGVWNFQYHMEHYGMFMWYDETIGLANPMCRHLDGRGFIPMEERIKEGWPAMNHHLHNVKDIIQKIHRANSCFL